MSENKVPSIGAKKRIKSVFEEDLPDMITRLLEIDKVHDGEEGFINSIMAMNFLIESHHCYLWGNFFSCIIMMCMAFETLLKTQVSGKKLNRLLSQAHKKNLINKEEYYELTELRKFRNQLVHFRSRNQLEMLDHYEEFPDEFRGDMKFMAQKSSSAIKLTYTFNRIQKNMFFLHKINPKVFPHFNSNKK